MNTLPGHRRLLPPATALLLATLALGCPDTPPSTTGIITGKVTLKGAEASQDLSGSLVTLGAQLVPTDASGSYRSGAVQAGRVTVRAAREGYVAQEQAVEVAAEETKEVNFELVRVNTAPVISSVSMDPPQLKPSATATIVVSAADAEKDALGYAWTATGGFTVEPGAEPGTATVTAPADPASSGVVTVVVTDPNGGEATAKLGVSTVENAAPVISSISATPSLVAPGGAVELSAFASDLDGAALSYKWTAPVGWTVTGSGATVTLEAPSAYGKSAAIGLEVSDEKGGKTLGQVTVATVQNAKPVVVSVTAIPSQVSPGGTVSLNVSAYDSYDDVLTYAWTAPMGWTVNGTGQNVTLSAPAGYGEVAAVTVEVNDGNGGVVLAQVVVSTAANRAPVLSSITATPPTVQKGGTVSLNASAADPDGDVLAYSWIAPSGWTVTPNGAQADLVAPPTAGTVGTVTVVVDDGAGGSAIGSVVVSTAANNGPIVSSITASPPQVTKGGTVALSVTASDPDGDALTYAWTVPPGWTLVGAGDTANETVTAPALPGKSGTASVVVTDVTGAQATASLILGTAPNTAPIIATFTASPTPAPRQGVIQVQASANDADADALTYTWTVSNPAWTLSGTGANITVTAPNTYAQSATLNLVVADAFGGSATANLPVSTRTNAQPQVQSLSSTPMPILPGTTATIVLSATDEDGDPLSYAWAAPAGWTVTGSGATVTVKAPFSNNVSGNLNVTIADGFGGTTAGTLVVATNACGAGTMNCDGTSSNGCESLISWDNTNCGGCGVVCGGGTPYCGTGSCNGSALPSSRLVTAAQANQINTWIGTTGGWRRCYSRTDHAASSSTFHTLCDGQGQSIVVALLSNGVKMGGYASASWQSGSSYFGDNKSFLFSLTNNFKHVATSTGCGSCWMYGNNGYGPTFGGGHDWHVQSGMSGGYCNIGYDYACRTGTYGTATCRDDFCGTYSSWTITDLEVWVR